MNPPPTWQPPQFFAQYCVSRSIFAALLAWLLDRMRFDGAQYLPHIPGELEVAGTPQIALWSPVNPSFLPIWECFPEETPWTGEVISTLPNSTLPLTILPSACEEITEP